MDLTPRLPYRASSELMVLYRARLRELLEPPEPTQRRREAEERLERWLKEARERVRAREAGRQKAGPEPELFLAFLPVVNYVE